MSTTTERGTRLHVGQAEPFRWDGVAELAYKETGSEFRDVTRRVLFDAEHGQGVQVRYFEVGPGGHTTLERHEHTHSVIPVRGAGRCLVGSEVFDLALHDLVFVPAWAWHQFRAAADRPLGILCLVTAERDRPVRPTAAELDLLRSDPAVAEFIRV